MRITATSMAARDAELEKISSALRKAVKVVEAAPGLWHMRLGDRVVGRMSVNGDQVKGVQIDDLKLRGMGLGRKFYGEVARNVGGTIRSDSEVSPAASRVWRSMEKSKSWKARAAPHAHFDDEMGRYTTRKPWDADYDEAAAQARDEMPGRPSLISEALPQKDVRRK